MLSTPLASAHVCSCLPFSALGPCPRPCRLLECALPPRPHAQFDEFDADSSGEIDLKEMRPFLIALKREWVTAEKEISSVMQLAELSKRRAAELSEVAEQMRKIQSIEQWLEEQETQSHPSLRFQELLVQRKGNAYHINSIADNWRRADGVILGHQAAVGRYMVSKETFQRGVMDLIANADGSPVAISAEEVGRWFDDELRSAQEAAAGLQEGGGGGGGSFSGGGAGGGAGVSPAGRSFKRSPTQHLNNPAGRSFKRNPTQSQLAQGASFKEREGAGGGSKEGGAAGSQSVLGSVAVAGVGEFADKVDLLSVLKEAKESRLAMIETRASVLKHLQTLRKTALDAQDVLVREAEEHSRMMAEHELHHQAAAKAQREAEEATARAKEEAKAAAREKAKQAQLDLEKRVENRRTLNRDELGLPAAAGGQRASSRASLLSA